MDVINIERTEARPRLVRRSSSHRIRYENKSRDVAWAVTDGVVDETMSVSDKVYHIIHSKYLHYAFSALLLVDICIVIASIALEIEHLSGEIEEYETVVHHCQRELSNSSDHSSHSFSGFVSLAEENSKCHEVHGDDIYIRIEEVLAYLSMAILSLFILESLVLFVAKPRVFCASGLHVFDLFVVATSLALEVVFRNEPEGGLRFARIGHGIYEEARGFECDKQFISKIHALNCDRSLTRLVERFEQLRAIDRRPTIVEKLPPEALYSLVTALEEYFEEEKREGVVAVYE